MRRRVLLASAAVLAVAACGGDDAADDTATAAVDGQAINAGPPAHIDPLLTYELAGSQIATALYDGLTEFRYTEGEAPELQPLLASEWTANDDATQWVFTLREGLSWSDGSTLLPSDFERGWDIAADPDTAAAYSYLLSDVVGFDALQAGEAEDLAGVVADDAAMTLTVDLTGPYADFPARVSHVVFSPMPPAREDLPDQGQWERGLMLGNGPYMQEQPANDQEIVLVANAEWAGDVYGTTVPATARVTYRVFADLDAAAAAFEAGEVQAAKIPPGRLQALSEQYPTDNKSTLASSHYFFGMREEDPLGGNDTLPLRKAISLAIDRQSIVDTVYGGGRAVASGITPPGVPGFTEGLGTYTEQDVDRARALVEEYRAGGGVVPEPIRLVYSTGGGSEDPAAIIEQNLEAIGLAVEQEPRAGETYFADLAAQGCPGMCSAGWAWDFPVYDNGLYDLFHSDSIGGNNLGGYSSPAFDDQVTRARATLDGSSREALLADAERTLLDSDVAAVPLNWLSAETVHSDRLDGFAVEPLGFVRWERVTAD